MIDFYSYNGGFAVQCAKAGARSVVAVDRSEAALANGRAAAEANGVAGICEFRRADAFEELERLAAAGEKFGVVIADPPAFVKSKKDLQAGTQGLPQDDTAGGVDHGAGRVPAGGVMQP